MMASASANIVVLQLDPEAPPGLLGSHLASLGGEVTHMDDRSDETLPETAQICAGLVVLGGTASAVDASGAPTFPALVDLLRARLALRRPSLGLGLGAQLLAQALGGAVRSAAAPEFGYVDLVPTEIASSDPVLRGIGAGVPVMLWHDDAIELPAAEPLAHCHRGRVLAFRSGPWAYGLQFHPGATVDIVRRWAALRGQDRNNPAVPVRIGAEIVRHQERAERFGRSVVEGWFRWLRADSAAPGSLTPDGARRCSGHRVAPLALPRPWPG